MLSSDNQHYEKVGKEINCIEDEIPFEIPESWEWCRLGSILTKLTDGTHSTPKYTENGIPFISVKDVSSGIIDFSHTKYISPEEHKLLFQRCNPEIGDMLLTKVGTTGIPVIVKTEKQFSLFVSVALLKFNQSLIENEYLRLLLLSPLVQKQCTENTKGVGNKNWVMRDIAHTLIVIPPLDEQHRIYEKFLSYEPIIEKYNKYATCLNKLNNEIKEKLKKSILQYAIQGKLVPQDPNDEPASVLLEHIREEKEQLIKEGKIKRDKNESYIYRGSDNSYYISFHGINECIDDEIPFEIPDNWCWVTLSSICTYIQRGKSPKYSDIEEIPVIAQKCNQWSGFDISKAKFIEPQSIDKYEPERYLCTGDLLWNSTGLGTVGRMAIYDESKNPYKIAVADSHVSVIRTKENFANYKYLFYWFCSPAVQTVIESKTEGSTKQKELYLQKIKDYVVPLPPLNEQHKIVSEIDKYMTLDF